MDIFILTVFSLYFVLMIFLIIGWIKTLRSPASANSDQPFISVITPVRNEEMNIVDLLNDFASQDYPHDRFEVFIVDDHSEDRTVQRVEKCISEMGKVHWRVIRLSHQEGKKAGITEGIRQSRGAIIVTTDADCRVQPKWLTSSAAPFENSDVKMMIGGVRLEASHFFGSLQRLESAALVGIGASTLAFGLPTMCNGANLAYRKEVFDEVGGYSGNETIASGDDVFLLRKIVSCYPTGVKFNARHENVVSTNAAGSVKEFFSQRIRWAGKWRSHGFGFSGFIALLIFIFHSSVLAAPVLLLKGLLNPGLFLALLGAKILLDGIFVFQVSGFLRVSMNWLPFLFLQAVYSPYAVFFGLTANFLRTEWKGRKI